MTILYGLPDDISTTSKPSVEWIEFIKMAKAEQAGGGGGIVEARKERNREMELYLASNPEYMAETTVKVTDTTYPASDPDVLLPARIYTPAPTSTSTTSTSTPAAPPPAMLWFHGGGFAIGSQLADDEVLRHISHHSHITIISASYRLAPEHPFPDGPNDAWAAARWATKTIPHSAFYVGGVSSGGNLACVVSRRARDTPEAGVKVAGQLLAYPWLCSTRDHGGFVATLSKFEAYTDNVNDPVLAKGKLGVLEQVYGSPDPRDVDFSPLFDPKELKGLPRAVVFVAGADLLRDDGVAYWRGLRREDPKSPELRIWPGLPHAFHRHKELKTSGEYKVHLNEGMKELLDLNSQTTTPTTTTAAAAAAATV